jgi:tetratricopeptide (TPR) repeat protein
LGAQRDGDLAGDPAALEEDVDLDPARRSEILRADQALATGTHWQVLGLGWNASVADVQAAYREQARVFHPDRYAGLRLGSYRARLERVFGRLTEARDVLADERRRAEYVRQTAPPEERARTAAHAADDARRAEERRARLERQSPLFARAGKVAELARRGKERLDQGKVTEAAGDLAVARALDPGNAELGVMADEARRRAAAHRAAERYERGLAAEAMGQPGTALAAFREALDADPRHVRAAAAGARAALALGDVEGARALAETAVRAGPRAAVAHEALGLVLDARGERREARRALERALELDPKLEAARERLRRLRWSFLG